MFSSAITYRRNRKIQAGGRAKMPYITCVTRSHFRPITGGTPITFKQPDIPDQLFKHGGQ
jgi:hypothetical protein